MRANVDGVVFGLRAVVPAIAARGGGAIVVTASLAGFIPIAFDPIYALTKHGVVGLVRSLAPTLAEQRITVNCVCPGLTDTPLIAGGRAQLEAAGFPLIPPSDIAAAVARVHDGRRVGRGLCLPGGPATGARSSSAASLGRSGERVHPRASAAWASELARSCRR